MATPAHHNLFSDEPLVAGPSLTTITSNLIVPLSSLEKDEATSIPQKLDNRAYLEKIPCLIDGHDDNDDVDDEHGDGSSDGSNEWGGGDVTAEYDGSYENSHGLVRCSSAASITSNYIHIMGELCGSSAGKNMHHTGAEKVWNNEKHNAYLDSMEENFVRDMYAHDYCSMELCGNQPHFLSESEASMVCTGTSSDMDEMMSNEEGSMPSSCSSWLSTSTKEKGSSHATTTKRTIFPSITNSGPSNQKNIIQRVPEMDIARLHKHATPLINPIQDSSPAIDSNVKKRGCPIVSHEESSMKTLKLAGNKCPFLSSYYDQVDPNPCIRSIGSHQDSQDMQGLDKITRAEAIGLGKYDKTTLTIQ